MSATIEYEQLILPHKFSSDYYFFVYAARENNVVGLIHTTPDSSDIPEADIPDEDLVDTMGYGMLESMERKNDNIYAITLIIYVGRNIEWMMTLTLCPMLSENIPDIIYIYIYRNI